MEERYHATIQKRFYPDMSNVNKNITVEAKRISPPTYLWTSKGYRCWNGLSVAYWFALRRTAICSSDCER